MFESILLSSIVSTGMLLVDVVVSAVSVLIPPLTIAPLDRNCYSNELAVE